MKKPLGADKEFAKLEGSGMSEFTRMFQDHLKAINSGDPSRRDNSVDQMAKAFGEFMAYSDLLGRRRSFLEGRYAQGRVKPEPLLFSTGYEVLPMRNVPFREAAADLSSRVPEWQDFERNGVPLWKQVAEKYQTEHVFSMAVAADMKLQGRFADAARMTMVAQEGLGRVMVGGLSQAQFQDAMEDMLGFSRSYSETVFRTQLNSSYTSGRRQQIAESPILSYVIPAYKYNSTMSRTSRDNHKAAHGLIAPADSHLWDVFSPPLGYNCKCSLVTMDRYLLERKGLIDEKTGIVEVQKPSGFNKAAPDTGFETKPGGGIYGVGPQPRAERLQEQSVNQAWEAAAERLGSSGTFA